MGLRCISLLFWGPDPLLATRCNLGLNGGHPAARLASRRRHGRCRMGLLRAQAVGLVQGTKHGAFQATSRDGCQPGPHCRAGRAEH